MNKLINILISIFLTTIVLSCSDKDDVNGENKGLSLLDRNKSFSLLVFTLNDANVPTKKISAFVEKYDPMVMTLKNINYNHRNGERNDVVTDIAYHSSFVAKQALQGVFSSSNFSDGKGVGVGLFSKETFAGVLKTEIDNSLTLHTMSYNLAQGGVINVSACEIATDNAAQLAALKKYASQVTVNTIIVATIHADEESSTIQSLKEVYNLTCGSKILGTKVMPTPEYLLTPKSQPWGVKYATVVSDDALSNFKGVFLRVGLTD